MFLYLKIIFLCLLLARKNEAYSEDPAVKVFTVATEETHGFQRFMRSAKMYGIDVEVLGMGNMWIGGNMNHPGGGQKVRLFKQRIASMQKLPDRDQIIIFTDSYDVMYLANLNVIVDKFKSMDVRVLFAAEPFCWPDPSLAKKYPNTSVPNPYLNSGGIIGYLSELRKLLNYKEISHQDDDQLFFTNAYLNDDIRKSYNIGLDHKSQIFQNLNGALSDVQLVTNSTTESPYLLNLLTNERPLIVHGNGPSKLTLNQFSNYLNNAWSLKDGCVLCEEKRIKVNEEELPTVMLAVFIEQTTPFMEEFLKQILDIDYPKNKLHLLLRNNVEYHETAVDKFFRKHSKHYLSAKSIKPADFISEAEARNIALSRCFNSECDYLFSLDSLSRLEPSTLRYLISTGYDVVAPLMVRAGQSWSNFWGAINSAGFYARSNDYMDIVYRKIIGIWNVPFITNAYLVNMSLFRKEILKAVTYIHEDLDPDMAFCAQLRDQGVMMHVSNEKALGHLINPESFDISRINPDIYQVIDNQFDWEHRYLHPEYMDNFADERNHSMLDMFMEGVIKIIRIGDLGFNDPRFIASYIPFLERCVLSLQTWNVKMWSFAVGFIKKVINFHQSMANTILREYIKNNEDFRKKRGGIANVQRDPDLSWNWTERRGWRNSRSSLAAWREDLDKRVIKKQEQLGKKASKNKKAKVEK